MAKVIPSRFASVSGGSNRVGKSFVGYLRNGHAETTAAAISARARPGMGVSLPVAWDQLRELRSGSQWTIAAERKYLSFQQDDPWKPYWTYRQALKAAMKMLPATG